VQDADRYERYRHVDAPITEGAMSEPVRRQCSDNEHLSGVHGP
jgi:hypothetical protein